MRGAGMCCICCKSCLFCLALILRFCAEKRNGTTDGVCSGWPPLRLAFVRETQHGSVRCAGFSSWAKPGVQSMD